jgi:hypothetical protein
MKTELPGVQINPIVVVADVFGFAGVHEEHSEGAKWD